MVGGCVCPLAGEGLGVALREGGFAFAGEGDALGVTLRVGALGFVGVDLAVLCFDAVALIVGFGGFDA